LCRKGWIFDLQYLLSRIPWDSGVTPPEVVELIEGDIPPGQALDLGCGTGTNCIYLAHHGWDAVGVDFSTVAIRRARRKARRARVNCRFYQGDATDLSFLTTPFDFVLDIGCLHSIPMESRERYAAEVARLVRPGGLYMLYAFVSRSHRPGPHGLTRQEIRHLFAPAFTIERQEGGEDPTGPASAWYWFQRRSSTPD
jgi:SAM-dependent methyltransferase